MTIEEAVLVLKRYQGYEPMEDGNILKHSFDLTDETVDTLLSAMRTELSGETLTMEQLREMDGKPVWVERNEEPYDGKWFIVDHADVENPDKTLYTKEGVTYSDYGKYFTAYAYPPAHIDREAWVSVEERLPEDEKDGETVLVIVFGKPHENITLHGAIMTAGYFRDEGWVLNEYPEWEGPEVTHWMPLPSPPAELEKRLRGVRA